MLLITGATGNVGRPLIDELLTAGAKVRATSRTPQTANLPDGVEVVGSLADPQSMADALTGVSAVFINPIAVGHATEQLLAQAAECGVTRVVVLSSGAIRDDLADQLDPLAAWHQSIEAVVNASGIGRTFIRPFEFAANVSQQWAPQIRYTATVREPYAEATSAVIHERDVAAVAATALLSDGHEGCTYQVTGPRSHTRAEMAEILAGVLDRPIAFAETPREDALQAMTQSGLPQPIAESVLTMRAMSVGRPAFVTDTVERITGRAARTFAEWAGDHAADFA